MENSFNKPTMTFLDFGSDKKFTGTSVELRGDKDTVDKLIKRFNRKMHKDGTIKYYCQNVMYYTKPSKREHDRVNKIKFINGKKQEELKKYGKTN